MKLAIVLIIGGFTLGIIASVVLTSTNNPDLYVQKDIPTTGYKSY